MNTCQTAKKDAPSWLDSLIHHWILSHICSIRFRSGRRTNHGIAGTLFCWRILLWLEQNKHRRCHTNKCSSDGVHKLAQHWVYDLITSAWADVWTINGPSLKFTPIPRCLVCPMSLFSWSMHQYSVVHAFVKSLFCHLLQKCNIGCHLRIWYSSTADDATLALHSLLQTFLMLTNSSDGSSVRKTRSKVVCDQSRRIVSSLIGLWRLAIVCRGFSESIIHKLSKNVPIMTCQL